MTFTLVLPTEQTGVVSAVLADGVTPATATLSGLTFASSDPTIFTAVQDTANPLAIDVTPVAVGSAVLSFSATATETDGTVHTVTGSATGVVQPAAVAHAAALIITFAAPTGSAKK